MTMPPEDDGFAAQIDAMSGAITAEMLLKTALQYLTQSEHTVILSQGSDLASLVQICQDMLEVTDSIEDEQKARPEGLLESLSTDVASFDVWRNRTDHPDGRLGVVTQRIGENAKAIFMWCNENLPHPPQQRLPLHGPAFPF